MIDLLNSSKKDYAEIISHFRLIIEQARKNNFEPLTRAEAEVRAVLDAKGKDKAAVRVQRSAIAWLVGFEAIGEIKRFPYIGKLSSPENVGILQKIQEESQLKTTVFAEAFIAHVKSLELSRKNSIKEDGNFRLPVESFDKKLSPYDPSNKKLIKFAIDLIKQHSIFFETEIRELREVLLALPRSIVAIPDETSLHPTEPETLLQILKWLVRKEMAALAEIRLRLLPLGLFPGEVIDRVNENALDIEGEFAFEERDDEILINKGVLTRIIDSWDPEK